MMLKIWRSTLSSLHIPFLLLINHSIQISLIQWYYNTEDTKKIFQKQCESDIQGEA